MKITAAVICRNEQGRFWQSFIAHLLEFVDEIRVWDDGSTDGGPRSRLKRVIIHREPVRESAAFHDHASSRNRLIRFALEGEPSHLLCVDGDEFITDGQALRKAAEDERFGAYSVCLQEVWRVRSDELDIRQDGGWSEHDVALLWRPVRVKNLTIADRGHATGRTPDEVGRLPATHTCSALLHLGWSNVGERAERFERYAVGDAGKYHAKAHIDSIVWPDSRMRFAQVAWPSALEPWRSELVKRANR